MVETPLATLVSKVNVTLLLATLVYKPNQLYIYIDIFLTSNSLSIHICWSYWHQLSYPLLIGGTLVIRTVF